MYFDHFLCQQAADLTVFFQDTFTAGYTGQDSLPAGRPGQHFNIHTYHNVTMTLEKTNVTSVHDDVHYRLSITALFTLCQR